MNTIGTCMEKASWILMLTLLASVGATWAGETPAQIQSTSPGSGFARAVFPLKPPKAKPSLLYSVRPIVRVPLVKFQAPKIDGDLSDTCWKTATSVAMVAGSGGRLPARVPSMMLLLADAKALHVAFICPLAAGASPLSEAKRRDRGVWKDESVEIFVDPGRTRSHYFQLILNTLNTQQDSEGWNGGWNGNWASAVVVNDAQEPSSLPAGLLGRSDLGPAAQAKRFWTGEVSIPYATLKVSVPRAGDVWGFNAYRTDKRKGLGYIWSRTKMSNHEPASFGEIRFVSAAPKAQFASLWSGATPTQGENQLTVHLLASGSGAPALQVKAQLAIPSGKDLNLKVSRATDGRSATVQVPLQEIGRHQMTLSLTKPGSTKVLDNVRLVFDLAPSSKPLTLKLDQKEYYLSESMARVVVSLGKTPVDEGRKAVCQLHSRQGRLLRRDKILLRSPASEIELDIRGLKTGGYSLTVSLGGHAAEQLFEVIRGPFYHFLREQN